MVLYEVNTSLVNKINVAASGIEGGNPQFYQFIGKSHSLANELIKL